MHDQAFQIGRLGQATCSVWSPARLMKVQGNPGQAGFLFSQGSNKTSVHEIQAQPQARQKMLRTQAKLAQATDFERLAVPGRVATRLTATWMDISIK